MQVFWLTQGPARLSLEPIALVSFARRQDVRRFVRSRAHTGVRAKGRTEARAPGQALQLRFGCCPNAGTLRGMRSRRHDLLVLSRE